MSELDADIQDSQILAISKQEANDAGNRIRFLAALPSGREVHSEWFDPGNKREALLKWVEVVRAQIVADREEAKAQARRRAMESRQAAPSAETLKSWTGQPATGAPPAQEGTCAMFVGPSFPSPVNVGLDPASFVRQALEKAQTSVVYWRGMASDAAKELRKAEADLRKWQTIAQSLNEASSSEATPAGAYAGQSTGDASSEQSSGPPAV